MSSNRLSNKVVAHFEGPGEDGSDYYIPFNKPTNTEYFSLEIPGTQTNLEVEGLKVVPVEGEAEIFPKFLP